MFNPERKRIELDEYVKFMMLENVEDVGHIIGTTEDGTEKRVIKSCEQREEMVNNPHKDALMRKEYFEQYQEARDISETMQDTFQMPPLPSRNPFKAYWGLFELSGWYSRFRKKTNIPVEKAPPKKRIMIEKHIKKENMIDWELDDIYERIVELNEGIEIPDEVKFKRSISHTISKLKSKPKNHKPEKNR